MIADVLTGWIDRLLVKPIRYLFETPKRFLKGYIKPGMTVLDVGCGKGYYSLGMARLVGTAGRVVCVDTEAEVIATLRKKAEEVGLAGRIETRVSSQHDLAISDLSSRVDFALAVYVVHHATDVAALMSGIHVALKPGAKFLVVEPRHHASPAECESIKAAARSAGFALVEHPKLKRDWAVVFLKTK